MFLKNTLEMSETCKYLKPEASKYTNKSAKSL